ncbi:MAG: hypothetical protein ACREEB_10190 [Caulobacteraceae bacterium]
MFDSAPTPQDPPLNDETLEASVARAERRLRLLEELAEIGMELARALRPGAAVDAPADDKTHGKARDPADAFAPLSRAIRLTLALEARTDEALRDLKAGVVVKREAERVQADKRLGEAAQAHEERVHELVMTVADAECGTVEEYENLYQALSERLDEDEAYVGYRERPLRETIERLCKDLTLTPDWSRWDGEGWIQDKPPARPRYSLFNAPSARPRRLERGRMLDIPAPPWRLHSDREPASHDLE